jgi:hypothetical protein
VHGFADTIGASEDNGIWLMQKAQRHQFFDHASIAACGRTPIQVDQRFQPTDSRRSESALARTTAALAVFRLARHPPQRFSTNC